MIGTCWNTDSWGTETWRTGVWGGGSVPTILEAIVAILEGVSGIGAVHSQERLTRSQSEWLALMTTGGIINGWSVRRESTEPYDDNESTLRNRHKYTLTGYYKIDDASASEKTFQSLVDLICQTFYGNETLTGSALLCDPLQVDYVGVLEVESGSEYYTHRAELSILVDERESL